MSTSPPGKWRFNIVYGLLVLAMVAMAFRICHFIATDQTKMAKMVYRQQRMSIVDAGRPGNIYATSGNALVLMCGSRPVPSCYAEPNMIGESDLADVAVKLGQAIQMDPVRIFEIFSLRRNSRFTWVKRQLTDEQETALAALKLPAVRVMYEWRREYPNGALGSTVIGFPPIPAEPNSGRDVQPGTGAGVELTQRSYLAARDGERVAKTDAARRPIWPLPLESTLPVDGQNVVLTIDAAIQGYLEKAVDATQKKYEAKFVNGIVVDPHTGEILAMCSYPTFNPNEYSRANPADRTNRTISLPYEPGSAFKPFIAAAAVDLNAVNFNTMIDCEGGVYNAPRGGRISDHGNRYGMLSVADIVIHSSNIGMAKIGEKLGNKALFDILHNFGFGQETGIELPGESRGIVRKLNRWDGYSLRRVPFGQEVSTTSLQLAMAFSALANGGELLRPRIVDRVLDTSGQVTWQGSRQVVRRVITPRTSQQILEVMAGVVDADYGTGKKARMQNWTSFGKTGTAQIPGGRAGYQEGAYTGTFIGGAPVNNPRAICLVSVYWPKRSIGYYGGTVAAPAVKEVLEQTMAYFDVPPDRTEEVASRE